MDPNDHLHWRASSLNREDSPPREGLFDEPTPSSYYYQDPLDSPSSAMAFPSQNFQTPRRDEIKSRSSNSIDKLGWGGKHALKKIEVSPGHFMRLRGADETYEAIKNDSYVPTTCYVCMNTILCIDSAEHVLCPDCKVVSPVREDSYGAADPSVGLGFTMNQLSTFVAEIDGTQSSHSNLFTPF